MGFRGKMAGRSTLSFALLVLAAAMTPIAAPAQDADAPEPEMQGAAPSDPAFLAFWERFREAVTFDDREAVRAMTRLPITLEGEAYDGAGFVERFDWLFTSNEKECFASETPHRDDDVYEVFCGGMIFVFRDDGGGYRFTEIGADD